MKVVEPDNPGRAGERSRWFRYRRIDSKTALRLFCFPFAGGSASAFWGWSDKLPREVELCAVQLPGRENRIAERPFTRMVELVETLVDVLVPLLDRPFAFFGHSMGATVAFEVVRRLRALQLPQPVHLFVSGCRAPHLPDPGRRFHLLPDAELIGELRKLEGTTEEVLKNNDLMQLLLPTLRADFELNETYVFRHGKPLDCGISAFCGSDDQTAPFEAVRVWREHTHTAFRFRIFEGRHFFISSSKDQVFEDLSAVLYSYLGRSTGTFPDGVNCA